MSYFIPSNPRKSCCQHILFTDLFLVPVEKTERGSQGQARRPGRRQLCWSRQTPLLGGLSELLPPHTAHGIFTGKPWPLHQAAQEGRTGQGS
ncbi:hypothetical protein VULLAG_LOCUS4027 [Vulpes lagopus]